VWIETIVSDYKQIQKNVRCMDKIIRGCRLRFNEKSFCNSHALLYPIRLDFPPAKTKDIIFFNSIAIFAFFTYNLYNTNYSMSCRIVVSISVAETVMGNEAEGGELK